MTGHNQAMMRELNGVVLASFPRSGSTLTRQFVAAAYSYLTGETVSVLDAVPNYEGAPYPYAKVYAGLPFTMRSHDAEPINQFRTHFMFRRPDDAIGSYFDMRQERAGAVDLERFYGQCKRLWTGLAEAALRRLDRDPSSINMMRYEDYLANPASEMRKLAAFLGLKDVPVDAIVVKLNEKFRRGAAKAATNRERGAIGANRKLLDEATQNKIARDLRPIYDDLCERVASGQMSPA